MRFTPSRFAADAAAIADAALRPNLHYGAVKSAEHQARLSHSGPASPLAGNAPN